MAKVKKTKTSKKAATTSKMPRKFTVEIFDPFGDFSAFHKVGATRSHVGGVPGAPKSMQGQKLTLEVVFDPWEGFEVFRK